MVDISASADPNAASGSRNAALREQKRSVEHAEHLGDLRRFRAGLLVALPTWVSFGALDWIAVHWAGAGSLAWFWSLRYAFFFLVGLPAALLARRAPPLSSGRLRVLDTVVYGGAAFIIAVMATRYGGITSSYLPGIMMVIVVRGVFFTERWTRALLPNVVMTSSFPIVMGIAALFVPEIRAQLSVPTSWSTGVHYLLFNLGTTVVVMAGGHHAWTLRRQLFETRSIGRYRLKQRIGAGGMGEVWAAYHSGLKRDVALKILRPDAAGDPTAIARFEREVKATTELSHPNTIRVFDFGVTDDGIFYYAMELLEGMTLAQLVREEGPLPPARAVHLVLQASRSLAEAHELGIVHRDVKPGNLFVTRAGGEPDFVKVLDFGIAKRAEADVDVALTGTGMLAGTPKYMAPEIVLGKPATPRADVYGMGAVLYFLLTGRAPFEGESASAIYVAHLTDEAVPPSVVRGEPIPDGVERIVARCLAKSPEERFADATELAVALADLAVVWRPERSGGGPSPRPTAPDGATEIVPAASCETDDATAIVAPATTSRPAR